MYKGLDKAKKGSRKRGSKIGKAIALGIGGAITAGLAGGAFVIAGIAKTVQDIRACRGRAAPHDRALTYRR